MLVIISTVAVAFLLVLGALLGSSWGLEGLRRLKHANAVERRELNAEWLLLRQARADLEACARCPLAEPDSVEASAADEAERARRSNGQRHL